jgi:hypothetical protein
MGFKIDFHGNRGFVLLKAYFMHRNCGGLVNFAIQALFAGDFCKKSDFIICYPEKVKEKMQWIFMSVLKPTTWNP